MAFDYSRYLRTDKLPVLWCAGCGDGIVMKAVVRAIDKLGWQKDDVAMVSGIGCSGRMSGYVDFNTLHTTHGRAFAFATGIKMARPDKHVIVITGDGDCASIGGNHFIHACRRNIDLTAIIINNFNYGLTGGQHSPTTPLQSKSPTASRGTVEPPFDLARLAEAAGATFVARGVVADPVLLEKMFEKGLAHKGMSVFDVFTNCHINYGRKNKLSDPMEMIEWMKEQTIPLSKYQQMDPQERQGKYPRGILVEVERPEYTEIYHRTMGVRQG